MRTQAGLPARLLFKVYEMAMHYSVHEIQNWMLAGSICRTASAGRLCRFVPWAKRAGDLVRGSTSCTVSWPLSKYTYMPELLG